MAAAEKRKRERKSQNKQFAFITPIFPHSRETQIMTFPPPLLPPRPLLPPFSSFSSSSAASSSYPPHILIDSPSRTRKKRDEKKFSLFHTNFLEFLELRLFIDFIVQNLAQVLVFFFFKFYNLFSPGVRTEFQ